MREFFRRGRLARVHADAHPHQPKHRPRYRGVALARLENGQTLLVSPAALALSRGRSRGGKRTAELGTGHKWTSDTARAAVAKRWAKVKRGRRGQVLGQRLIPKVVKPAIVEIVGLYNSGVPLGIPDASTPLD